MTPLVAEILDCFDREKLETLLQRRSPELIERIATEWQQSSDTRLEQLGRRMAVYFGSDDVKDAASIAITKLLDDFLGPQA